uniref:Protein CONTINUOUS VASCULAR RING 1 n=1 Tax=Aegilops tauschii subsp. strangulata TaxID=200361 RepID=A0A452ZM81_AEGTS
HKVVRSWASKKFMTGCVILFPIAITFYFTWWFIHFVDGFFSPIYAQLGINIFGLGFITSVTFIFFVGVFMSSWVGASVLGIGEWIIKRMPLVRHIYNASKQISAAISPGKFTVIMIFNLQSNLCPNFCFFLQIKTNRHSRRQSSYDILVLGNMHLDSLPHQSRSRAIVVKRTFTVSMCRPTISTLVISSW